MPSPPLRSHCLRSVRRRQFVRERLWRHFKVKLRPHSKGELLFAAGGGDPELLSSIDQWFGYPQSVLDALWSASSHLLTEKALVAILQTADSTSPDPPPPLLTGSNSLLVQNGRLAYVIRRSIFS